MMAFALKRIVKKGLVVGVDCSAEILKEAAARGARVQVAGVQFRKGDITEQACVDMVAKHFAGNYDLITAIWVVSAIPVALQASTLKMWAEMLKPGGRLIVERGNSRGDEDTGEAWRIPGHSQPVQTVLPRYAVADQTSYDMCKRELEELAAAAGLTVVSTHRYFTHYLDHSAKTAEDAQEQWAKENGGPMPRNFMLSCRQEVIRNDMEMYQSQNFGFGLKNVSMIMILQEGGGGNAK